MIHFMKSQQVICVVGTALATAYLLSPLAQAEQWAYAMQTGHGNHSIQVDVDSITQKADYVAALLLYEYYADRNHSAEPSGTATARSALVAGAFDCKGKRYQALSRTEYSAPEAKGVAGPTTKSNLSADAWKSADADPETYAIVDWVCGVAAHRLTEGQTGSMP